MKGTEGATLLGWCQSKSFVHFSEQFEASKDPDSKGDSEWFFKQIIVAVTNLEPQRLTNPSRSALPKSDTGRLARRALFHVEMQSFTLPRGRSCFTNILFDMHCRTFDGHTIQHRIRSAHGILSL